ncbi:hypothetical protein [Ruminiclostridium papyrosolvens]|uniref:Uncharacterized protein n=1 Tax=Ruminiclostridium papyrosolvens C7 TaxID=1330534 RepID=U4QZB9_9FIRM|nr:hypothetical protein [Ruminiclostridium papyrosolvens]EPR10218.1 hypothetical protein L323_14430 [Ruminiclostridium papyrosolvens C7]
MRRKLNIKKNTIKPEQIKANIYDTVQLIVDITGVTSLDLDYIQSCLKSLFPSNLYTLMETELYPCEVEDLSERRPDGITITSQKRLIEKETVLRFVSKDESEEISISRLFIIIKLNYKSAHKLSEKIDMIREILSCFFRINYFEIVRITLNKKDNIICNSLYMIYQCFVKSMFGDITYTLGRKGEDVKQSSLENKSYLMYGENIVKIYKSVQNGNINYNDKKKEVYEGNLNITMSYECLENYDANDTKLKFIELNNIAFQIFMNHITGSFAEDLVLGNTNKVLGGFNINE